MAPVLKFIKNIKILFPDTLIRFNILKKNNWNFFMVKSNIRYKISKYTLNKINNKFSIVLDGCNLNNKDKIVLLSSVYLNLSTVTTTVVYKNKLFFTI